MKRNKITVILVLMVVMALLFSACGNQQSTDASSENSTNSSENKDQTENETQSDITNSTEAVESESPTETEPATFDPSVLTSGKWWSLDGETIVLNEDNSAFYGQIKGNWSYDEGVVTLALKVYYPFEYYFDIIETDEGIVLKRQAVSMADGKQNFIDEIEYYSDEQFERMKADLRRNQEDTLSSDYIEVTIQSAEFAYYASGRSSKYAEPCEDSEAFFEAERNHALLILTYTVKNNDKRKLKINNYNGGQETWNIDWSLYYNDNKYTIHGFDLNAVDGRWGLNMDYSVVLNEDGSVKEREYWQNGRHIVDHYPEGSEVEVEPGESVILRSVGVVAVDPDSFEDSYELQVNVPNADGGNEHYFIEMK